MKKFYVVLLLAGCVSLLSAQTPVQPETSKVQTELRRLHSTIKALQRSQASQKKTFNILALRMDSLQQALQTTQVQTQQSADSIVALSKARTEQASRIDAIEVSLDTRTALIILALVAVAGLSLVIFFTLKKAIAESSEIVLQQTLKTAQAAEAKKQETVSALITDARKKNAAITLPIEPGLFTPAATDTTEEKAAGTPASKPQIHVAIAEMIQAPERKTEEPAPAHSAPAPSSRASHKKAAQHQCQGVTKTGARCKRKALAGTHFCSQHAK